MEAQVTWKGQLEFEGESPSGGKLLFDGSPDHNGPGQSPMEALLCAVAACTAIDVLSILEKKRQTVTSYKLDVSGDRPPAGVWPRPFTKITIRHHLVGDPLDPVAVARAVELSDEKYCSVSATLRLGAVVESEWTVNEPSNPGA